MEKTFPKTTVGGLEVSRMVIGSNWILGYSHKTHAASKHINEYNCSAEVIARQLEVYLKYGVNTILGPMTRQLESNGSDGLVKVDRENGNIICDAIALAEEHTGQKMIKMTTTSFNTENSAEGRRLAKESIKNTAALGAQICYLAFSDIDKLFNHEKRTLERFDDYTYMVREAGMIPMAGNHDYRLIPYIDSNGYDVECYLTPYNCAGFYLQMEVEGVYGVIHRAKKPVVTIKSMAAGRLTPLVGLTFNYSTIRSCDMVAVGAFTPAEAEEDIRYGFAAIEHSHEKR